MKKQRQQHQGQARCENGLVADAAVRQITQRDLHDVSGDGCRRFRGIPGQIGLHAGGHRDNHGFSDRTRDAEDVSRGNAGESRRGHDANCGLEACRAHRIGTFAHRHRHRAHCVLGNGTDVGNDHDAHDQSRGQKIEAGQPGKEELQRRGHVQQGEISVNDGGHAAQQFEKRLGDFAHRKGRKFRQVNGDHGAERYCHGQRHQRAHQRARKQHHDAVVGVVEQRRPLFVGEEIDQRDLLEKLVGLAQQDQHDADGDHNRDRCRKEEHALDHALAHMPGCLLREPRADCVIRQGIQGMGGCDGTHRFGAEGKIYYRILTMRAGQKTGGAAPLLPICPCRALRASPQASSIVRSSDPPCSRRRTWCPALSSASDRRCRCRRSPAAAHT